MSKLKVINFINPRHDEEQSNIYDLLVDCVTRGFAYPQTKQLVEQAGYYLPEDQFNSFNTLILVMIDLDIGIRRDELNLNLEK